MLAQTYIDRISTKDGADAIQKLLTKVDEEGVNNVLDSDGRVTSAFGVDTSLLQTITLIWYSATVDGEFGESGTSQYIQGLEWRAMSAHPMGFANENVPFYWQYKPEADMYTGLISWKQPS